MYLYSFKPLEIFFLDHFLNGLIKQAVWKTSLDGIVTQSYWFVSQLFFLPVRLPSSKDEKGLVSDLSSRWNFFFCRKKVKYTVLILWIRYFRRCAIFWFVLCKIFKEMLFCSNGTSEIYTLLFTSNSTTSLFSSKVLHSSPIWQEICCLLTPHQWMAMFSHVVGSLAKSPVPRDQTKTLASSLWEDWYGCSVWSLAQPLIWKCMRNRADKQKTRQNGIMGTGDKTPPAFEDPSCLGIDFFSFFLRACIYVSFINHFHLQR